MTINYACKLAKDGLDEVVFSNYIPLPGSDLFDRLFKEGNLNIDWKNLIVIGDLLKAK
jgi:hypothetical protein